MAAKKAEDSKQGLIIALVIMFLLCIGLGVGTYYGFADQDRLAKEAKAAKDADTKNKNAKDWERYQNLLLKAYIGHTLPKEDQDALTSLQDKFDGGSLGQNESNYQDFKALVAKLAGDDKTPGVLGWDTAKKQPANTFFGRLDTSDALVKQAKDAQAKAEEKFKKDLETTNQDLADVTKDRDKWKKTSDDLTKENANLKTNFRQGEYAKLAKQAEGLSNDLEDLRKKMETSKEDAKKAADKLAKDNESLKLQISKLNDQIKPVNVLDYDKPKGKIVNVEGAGSVVYVNLGSGDNVKPQLTFSIYGADSNGLASHHRKGALEVTKILGPHLSQANVTETTDRNRDPILTGDLLFNPTWTSSLRQHVAVTGLIDLIGDGSNNTQEFIRTLGYQGIIVDAYLDLKDLKVKGDGISAKTQYLVLGDQPEAGLSLSGTDIRTGRKEEMWKKMKEMQDEAHRLGVTIVPYRRFLTVIGYPMPRVLANKAGRSGFLESPLLGSGMERKDEKAPKEGAKEKGKEAKEAEKEK
jgi:hypothetical protein